MTEFTATRFIEAPVTRVFATVAHIEEFRQVVPHIVDVEFLSEQRTGAGTRFRETRLMGKRKAATVLEVTEYTPDEQVRLVSEAGGTVWDTVFLTVPEGSGTSLTMTMVARPQTLLGRVLTPLIARSVDKAVEADMDAVKAHLERNA